jgi:hypothetical protein
MPNLEEQFWELLLQRIAGSGISPSAAQNQGPPGTLRSAQEFLFRPSLIEGFSQADTPESFRDMLDKQTDELRLSLPLGKNKNGTPRGRHWGSARKFLNIFLFECTLNRYLCNHYKNLHKLEPWLEVPLDSLVGNGLAHEKEGKTLQWVSIIGLEKEASDQFQKVAQLVANKMNTYRVHLDLYYLRYRDTSIEQ